MQFTAIEHHPFHKLAYVSSAGPAPSRRLTLPFLHATVDTLGDGSLKGVVVASDLQGRELDAGAPGRLLGEAVAEELALLGELEEIPPTNQMLVLLCGDLFDYPDLRKKGGSGPVDRVWQAFSEHFCAVLGVEGNHDQLSPQTLDHLDNATLIDGAVTTVGGLSVGGVSGIIGRASKHNRREEPSFLKLLSAVLRKRPDLLLLHEGPDWPADGYYGSPAIRTALEQDRGDSIVCFGHSHWPKPLVPAGKRQLLSCDGRVVVLQPER